MLRRHLKTWHQCGVHYHHFQTDKKRQLLNYSFYYDTHIRHTLNLHRYLIVVYKHSIRSFYKTKQSISSKKCLVEIIDCKVFKYVYVRCAIKYCLSIYLSICSVLGGNTKNLILLKIDYLCCDSVRCSI